MNNRAIALLALAAGAMLAMRSARAKAYSYVPDGVNFGPFPATPAPTGNPFSTSFLLPTAPWTAPAVSPNGLENPYIPEFYPAEMWAPDITAEPYVNVPNNALQLPATVPGDEPQGGILDIAYTPPTLLQNVAAFLKVIRTVESNDNYGALVGGGEFTDFSDHPAKLGWAGIRRPDGRMTTAAGAYQITKSTWDEINKRVKLPDFSPASQDIAATIITQFPWRAGAYRDIIAGKFDVAIQKLKNEWESFAKILAGTYPYTYAQIQQIYANEGGQTTGSTYA